MRSSKILLLENVAAQAAAARNALSGTDYQLLISRFEANGIKRAREWKPDVIVLANTYAKGGMADFSRRLKDAAGGEVRIVIASSLTLERLGEAEPDLRSIADGFVLRPYSPVTLKGVLDDLTGKSLPGATGSRGEGKGRLGGKGVLILDRDPEVLRVLREHLMPRGVKVDAPHWEKAADYCRSHHPQAVVLEWPTPSGFTIETLREIREAGQGRPAAVVLLSRAGQEVVRTQSPAMHNQADMLFTKPVSWGPFFRYLSGVLKSAPAAPAPGKNPSPPGEGGIQDRFQKKMEAKFLEVEELKKRLRAAEGEGGDQEGGDRGEVKRLREENARLQARIDEEKTRAEVEIGKRQLREAELEVKLNNLIRTKSDAERRAQDLIDAGAAGVEEARQKLEETYGELQVRLEEATALRSDLEQALVQKEQVEEKLQSLRGSLEKEREEAELKRAGLLADLEEARAEVSDLRGGEEERLRLRGEEQKEEERLRGELAELRERSNLRELKLTALQEEVDSLQESRQREDKADKALSERLEVLEGELEEKEKALSSLSAEVEERDATATGLRDKLRESSRAVAGLDEELSGWKERWAESEAQIADLAAREARLLRECEELQAKGDPERIASLEALLAEKDEKLQGLEEKNVVTGAFASELEAKVRESEDARKKLEERLQERDGLVSSLEERFAGSAADASSRGEALREREEELRGLRELLRELKVRHQELREEGVKEARSREAVEEELRGLREQLRELKVRHQELLEEGLKEARSREAVEEEHRRAMEQLEESRASLAAELESAREKAASAEGGDGEFERVQRLLQEVTAKAQSEVIERTRAEVELQERLKSSVEEKKFLLTRLEKEVAEAGEREKRLTELLDNALRGSAEILSAHSGRGQGNLPVVVSPPPPKPGRLKPAMAAVLALALLAGGGWLALRGGARREVPADPPPAGESRLPPSAAEEKTAFADPVAPQREVWEDWTRSDVSGGVLLQATLRSREEMAAEVEVEQRTRGWSDEEAARELSRLLEPYRFEENFYLYLYLKNLQPGYPSYVDDIYTHLTLRDDKGNEAEAFLPADMERHRRVYSFTAGELSKSRADLVYEVTVPVAFSRGSLTARPAYIQLLAYNIGASSRRVLTWELE